MKKKWIIAVAIVLLAIATVAVILVVKQNDASTDTQTKKETEMVSIVDDCWEHVTDMNFVEQSDGTVVVTLTAPDYVSLVRALAEKNHDAATEELVTQAVKKNPRVVKEYTFTASSLDESDVKEALMEQISYELVALTLEGMNG